MTERIERSYVPQEPEKESPSEGKIAFVFPGQGSQFVGMGQELYNTSKAAKEVFDEADSTLGMSLTRVMFEGPDEELWETINSQPAIMAMSLACVAALEELRPQDTFKPVALAGHSLGEYTTLVVSRALDLPSGIRLVRERGRLMQEAGKLRPGSMAAIIGLDEQIIEEICRETGAEIANINGDNQIVLSGDQLCVTRAVDMASIRGARKAISLAVSGAFHSSLMLPAREGLAIAIEQIKLDDPRIPIIGNSNSTPLTTAQGIKEELLAQLTSCVQWKSSVGRMIDGGIVNFIELGPGKVLGGLIKRISGTPAYKDIGIRVSSIGDLRSIQNFNPLPA